MVKDRHICKCHKPPLFYKDYIGCFVGIDYTNQRYGEVSIEKCIHCNSKWLVYHVEYEAFSESGRWFRCLIRENEIENITPENSVDYLDNADWYIYGGSYYRSQGRIGNGEIDVDFLTRS